MGRDAPRATIPSRTLEEYAHEIMSHASACASATSARDATGKNAEQSLVLVRSWCADARVFLLVFPSAHAQRRALGRASMYLEDPETLGVVASALPSGARGGVANYSGHNMRVSALCRFIDACGGVDACWEEERELMRALMMHGIVTHDVRTGMCVAARDVGKYRHKGEACVVAVQASGDAREVKDALIHEAMHGLWYARSAYAEQCYAYYASDALDARERAIWVDFLRELRYATEDEEVVVNEFQAYMATETQMFGGGGNGGGSGATKKGGGKKSGSSSSSSSSIDALTAMQVKFAEWARNVVADEDARALRCGETKAVFVR